nr:EOG090X0C9C [Polyphemus pediculus]
MELAEMASSCELSKLAYSKIILHSVKYPQSAINGVLLSQDNHTSNVKIVDSIPLFHNNLGLTPMLEVALMQIDSYCRSAGLVIAGYYQANDSLVEQGPDFVGQKVCEKIAEHFPNAILVIVNNQQLGKRMTQPSINVIQYADGRWKVKDKESVKLLPNNETVLSFTSGLLQDKRYQSLIDFDDHLDDISQDWLNLNFKKVIEEL